MVRDLGQRGGTVSSIQSLCFPTLSAARWAVVILAACIIAPASLFVHDFMLDWLRVPYPKVVGLPVWATALMLIVKLLAIVVFCQLALPQLKRASPPVVACAIGILVLMLHETGRVIVIEHSIFNNWSVAILDGAAAAISIFLEVSIVVYAFLKGARWRVMLAVIAIVTVIGAVLVSPWLAGQFDSLRNVHYGDIKEIYKDPYPSSVNVVIYTAFIEPTVATFVLAALCWNGLPGNGIRRICAFTTLVLLIRGRFILEMVFSFWVRQPLPTAFLATGQFFLETMVLGILVGTTWALLRPRRTKSPLPIRG